MIDWLIDWLLQASELGPMSETANINPDLTTVTWTTEEIEGGEEKKDKEKDVQDEDKVEDKAEDKDEKKKDETDHNPAAEDEKITEETPLKNED